MNKEQLRIFSDPNEAAAAFGRYLMNKLEESQNFHCALSGGSTPKLLFEYLASHYKDSKGWSKLHVYWGDERCVPPEHNESNFKMTKDLLLGKVAIPEGNVHRIMGENDPSTEALRYSGVLKKSLPETSDVPVLDMVILGMGDDGHTASIFPHEIELLTSDQACAVATHPTTGQNRVTLTGQVINAAREVIFLVTGEGKKSRVSEIFNKEGEWEKYPVSYISPASGKLLWYVDQAAVSSISPAI